MTTCSNAIKAWEAKHQSRAEEAKEVKLYGQSPPIVKMDNSLNSLKNCEHLSLSTNSIDKFIPLPGLKRLRILSIGRNQLKKIDKLDDLAETLEELWLSYNQISSLDGLSSFKNLKTLFMSNNNLKSWAELDKLKNLENLRDVFFFGNPMYGDSGKDDVRIEILRRLPQVTKIDGDPVTHTEVESAANSSSSPQI